MTEHMTMRMAMEFAVKVEELGAKLYDQLAKRFDSDSELRELFGVLANDEIRHAKTFKALLDGVPAGDQPIEFERGSYLKSVAISEIFVGKNCLRDPDKIRSREDALDAALNLEKSTLLYYREIREDLREAGPIDAVIDEERRHVKQVVKYMITGAKMRGLQDEF